MMIYADTGPGLNAIDAAVTMRSHSSEVVSDDVYSDTPPELTPIAVFKQRVIALDSNGQTLRLWEDTSLKLNLVSQEFEVEGWGIRMKMNEVIDLPREMGRQFLRLWSRAERGQLHGDEQGHWKQIVDIVDFQSFCNERAPYLYAEGEVIGRTREGTIVKWANGREEVLRGKFGVALDLINIGEMFSAAAKLNREGRVNAIENVTVLGTAKELLQEMDDDWIRKV